MSDTFSGFVSPLSHFGLIYISGPDCLNFLQGQTTIDVKQINPERCMPGAFCNPKGRVIATFMALTWHEGVMLVLSSELVASTIAHLSKYAAFSKTTLVDHSKHWHLLGIDKPLDPISDSVVSAGWDDNRHLVFLNPIEDDYEAVLERHLTERTVILEDTWQACDIQMGLVWIDASTTGEYTPHHINLQWNQGVNFKKGCYTGQEVVSRMHFKGKLKTFAFALQSDHAVLPYQKLYGNAGQPVGEVVNMAKGWVMAVLKQEQVWEGIYSDTEQHHRLKEQTLPYQEAIAETLLRQQEKSS